MRTKQKKRMRKSTKYAYVIIAIIFFLISISSLIENLLVNSIQTKTEQIYRYTNKFNYDYKVKLARNDFMKTTEITDKDIAYVTDLIDVIALDLNYEYLADKSSDLKCAYSIIGKMQVVYTKDGEEQKIWEEDETLLEEKQLEKQAEKIKIEENLELDLKEKNELLKQFKQKMGMTISATYTVMINTNIKTRNRRKRHRSQLYTNDTN